MATKIHIKFILSLPSAQFCLLLYLPFAVIFKGETFCFTLSFETFFLSRSLRLMIKMKD